MRINPVPALGPLCFFVLFVFSPASAEPWRAKPDVVERNSTSRKEFNYHEERVPQYTLPEVLTAPGAVAPGSDQRATSVREWEQRVRPAVLEAFREHVYGRLPQDAMKPRMRFETLEVDKSAMDGAATLKRVRMHVQRGDEVFPIDLTLFVPNEAKKPVPVFLLLNHRGPENIDPTRQNKSEFWPAEQVIGRGYGIAAVQVTDVQADSKAKFEEGVRGFYGETDSPGAWGTLAAWAWAGSRALDYFETDKDVDARRIAVVGHSRGGKTSLWAGASDERFALTISNDSGCGGAALSRRRFGETVARINASFPHWFNDNFNRYNGNEDALPVDQHQLIALVAPRAVYVASADEDLWADPLGEYLSLAHASPVYKLYGFDGLDPRPQSMSALDVPTHTGRMGHHVRSGVHNLTPVDWNHYMDFADRLWGK